MKRLLLLLIVSLLCIAPVMGQDATAEVTNQVVEVIGGEGEESPSVSCEEGSTCLINEGEEEGSGEVIDQSPVNDSLAIVVIVVLGTLLTGAGIYGAYITGWIAKLVPPETAASIFQAGFRFGIQMALNQAAGTAGTADDDFFLEMAKARGLTVNKRADGTYEVIQSSVMDSNTFSSTAAANLR